MQLKLRRLCRRDTHLDRLKDHDDARHSPLDHLQIITEIFVSHSRETPLTPVDCGAAIRQQTAPKHNIYWAAIRE